MIRILPIFILAIANSLSFADELRLEGEPYQPAIPIVWKATNEIPRSLTVYRAIPRQFSNEIISNMLQIASFEPVTMELSVDKKTMSWRHYGNDGKMLLRSLDISPAYGYISHHNYQTIETSTNQAQAVPTFEQVEALALDYLQRLGGDTNELFTRSSSRTDEHRTLYDKKPWKGGHVIAEDFTMRGVMFTRQVDGIRFVGEGGRGGFSIEFGSHAAISHLELVWRNLRPDKQYATASPDEIIAMIKTGKAVVPLMQDADLDEVPQVKALTITGITPYFWGEIGGAPQDFVYPFAELQVVGKINETNTISFVLQCPILSTNTVSP
ncbi:MAG: hypothetical protein ACLQSR_03515 [Limisphaerales bacterium]